jgi:hypothetical protein
VAETLATTIALALNAVQTNPNATFGNSVFTLALPSLLGGVLATGTGADKADQLYVAQVTLAASGNTSINLHSFGGAVDQLGQAIAMVNVKALAIQILGNLGCLKVTAVAVNAAGTGYLINDVLTGASGTGTKYTATVTSVGGGGTVTGISLTTAGSYTVASSSPDTPTGGTGTGATLTITSAVIVAATPPVFVEGDFLTIGNVGTTAGWTSVLGTNTDTIKLKSGTSNLPGTIFICEGGATGFVVGASSTNNILNITNSGSNPITFLIVVIGATA